MILSASASVEYRSTTISTWPAKVLPGWPMSTANAVKRSTAPLASATGRDDTSNVAAIAQAVTVARVLQRDIMSASSLKKRLSSVAQTVSLR